MRHLRQKSCPHWPSRCARHPPQPPTAGATRSSHPARGGGLSGGELWGEAWVQTLRLSEASHPPNGVCNTLARNVIAAVGSVAGPPTCTVTPRTRLLVFNGSFCSSAEGPDLQTAATSAGAL